ncbi:MAG TPA: hydrogenase formation protein HypD [Candidatus Obscuribacterales bacterium]
MKYLDEYRDRDIALRLCRDIKAIQTRPWTIMEVCGGQTHTILQYGIEDLLPPALKLVHGPGCPICVTPVAIIDKAIAIAQTENVIFCSFGDMLRVPGSDCDLLDVKARGGDVRVVYSPLDCLKIARDHKDTSVVFFAVGFETTAPANAMAVWQARELGLRNFFMLTSHVTVPPVVTAILQAPGNQVQAFLGPGHVCSIMGYQQYEPITRNYGVPIVISGFEPLDLLEGIYRCVEQLERGKAQVENQYLRAVDRPGNKRAQALLKEVFDVVDREWRGLGAIPKSGYKLSYSFRDFDAERFFDIALPPAREAAICISGQILRGLKKPSDCPAFGTACTPERPLGATMVSAEGTCASYYKFKHWSEDHA